MVSNNILIPAIVGSIFGVVILALFLVYIFRFYNCKKGKCKMQSKPGSTVNVNVTQAAPLKVQSKPVQRPQLYPPQKENITINQYLKTPEQKVKTVEKGKNPFLEVVDYQRKEEKRKTEQQK